MTTTLIGDRKGFTLLEIIVTIAIASVVMGAVVTFMERVIHFKGTADTIKRFEKIEGAFEVLTGKMFDTWRELPRADRPSAALAILPSVDDDDTPRTCHFHRKRRGGERVS